MASDTGRLPDLGHLEEELLAMKNRSELMLDLAYSALLANNRSLARAVVDLEGLIDQQQFDLQRQALSTLAPDHIDRALTLIRLAESLEVIGDSAREIADVVLREVEPHPVLQLATEEADANIFQVQVAPGSRLEGATLGELRLASEVGAWVIALQRREDWVIGPGATTGLRAGDHLYSRGPGESRELLAQMAAAVIPSA